MYKELSTQFNYNEFEFKNKKSRELLTITCPTCNIKFQLTKHQIQTNWRRSKNKILYCTNLCSKTVDKETKECLTCNKIFTVSKDNSKDQKRKFCSNSCSVTTNNTLRAKEKVKKTSFKVRKQKLSKTIKQKVKYKIEKKSYRYIYTEIFIKKHKLLTFYSECKICQKILKGKNKKLSICSKECFTNRMKQVHLEKPHLILNRSNPESYLEKSFREYIESLGYIKDDTFIQEKSWTLLSGKRYISDFYFPSLKLIIEMDGKQHEQTVKEDSIKDNSLLEEFNIKTLRITHKEWKHKIKQDILHSLLI